MNDLNLIIVPKETVSDNTYQVARLHFSDGAVVRAGDVVATLETSKATVDVPTRIAGHIYFAIGEGQAIAVGAVLAAIAGEPRRPEGLTRLPPASPAADGEQTVFSQPALRLIQEHKLDRQVFAGLPLVRTEEVERFLAQSRGENLAKNLPAVRKNHILIWGGGGHAKVCIEILRAAGMFEPYGIIDGKLPIGSDVLGVPVIGTDATLGDLFQHGLRRATVGIGAVTYHARRFAFYERLLKAGFEVPNLIHPRASVDPSVRMGEGNQIFAHATISADVSIGNGCIINSGAIISHDCSLGNNIHLAPGALLAGGVKIGDDTLVGMAAAVYLYAEIGRGVQINNGANVDSNVPDGVTIRRTS